MEWNITVFNYLLVGPIATSSTKQMIVYTMHMLCLIICIFTCFSFNVKYFIDKLKWIKQRAKHLQILH